MDKIFHSTFDFFSHAIPGVCLVSSFYLLDENFESLQDLLIIAEKMKIGSSIFLLLIGYIAGFAIYPIGRYLYKNWGFKIWKRMLAGDITMHISEKYVLVRELSTNNFKYVELWNMFCAMAHNFAVASIVILIIILDKNNIS